MTGMTRINRIHPSNPWLVQKQFPILGRTRPHPGPTAVELSQLLRTWSAEFIPLPADLHVPRGGGLKSALLNSTAVGVREGCGRLGVGECWELPTVTFFRSNTSMLEMDLAPAQEKNSRCL